MPRILRITNTVQLRSSAPLDTTRFSLEATHVYFYFAEYHVLEDGTWEEGGAWASTVSIKELASLLDEAGLLREIAPSKQSGGSTHEREL